MNLSIALIIPVFNEEEKLEKFYRDLKEVLNKAYPDLNYDFYFVNDGSQDLTQDILNRLSNLKDFFFISLSKNYGKELAILSAFQTIKLDLYDAFITLDCDYQHDINKLSECLSIWKSKGCDSVVGIKKDINQNFLRLYASKIYNLIIYGTSKSQNTDFRLVSKKIAKEFSKTNEKNIVYRNIIDELSNNIKYFYFSIDKKFVRKSKFNFKKLVKMFSVSVVKFSNLPIYFFGFFGITLFLISSIFILIFGYNLIFNNVSYFSNIGLILILNTFLISIVLISITVCLGYMKILLEDISGTPNYFIEKIKIRDE